MVSEEQKRVLKMLAEGKISPEDADRLLEALEESVPAESRAGRTEPSSGSESEADRPLEAVRNRVRRLWAIPMGAGIGLVVLGSLWMFLTMRASGFGFWFYCAGVPFLLGVVTMALAYAARTSPWLFVRVERAEGEGPKRFVFGFPLPLGLAGWGVRTFGHRISRLDRTVVDEVVQALDETAGDSPLIVHVDEDEDGERVQVFIG